MAYFPRSPACFQGLKLIVPAGMGTILMEIIIIVHRLFRDIPMVSTTNTRGILFACNVYTANSLYSCALILWLLKKFLAIVHTRA